MAVSFLEEPHCRLEKATIISNSENLPAASKATELCVSHDLKKSNECKHFTIRGYVAEVRERDAKKCFPFLVHNCVSLEPANVFPPLPVSKFRRWGCQNCVYEVIAMAGQMDIGSMYKKDVNNNNNLLLRKDAETSQLDARKALSRLPQNLAENQFKKEKDCSVSISRVGKEGNKWLRRDLIQEGVQKYKDGQISKARIQDFIELDCLPYGCSAVNIGRSGKYRSSVGREKLGVAYVKGSLDADLVKHKRSKLQKVGHPKMVGGDATSIRVNFRLCCSKEVRGHERKKKEKLASSDVRQGTVVEKDDVQGVEPAHIFSLGACCHDKRTCGASVESSESMGLTDCKHQIQNKVENIHAKKIRKVRLLEDIISSEKQYPSVLDFMRSRATSKEKVPFLNHESQEVHLNNVFKCVRGKSGIQNFFGDFRENAVSCIDEKNHCAHQINQLKSVKRKKGHENRPEDDPFLMHWTNNMTKDTSAYVGEANFSADLFGGKDQVLDLKDNGITVSKQKSTCNRKHGLGLKEGQSTLSTVIHEEMKSKFFSQDTSRSLNSARTRGTSEMTGDAILYRTGNRRTHENQVINYQDSSTQNKVSLKVCERVSKKPRSNQITDQEAVDDIPMDIVELLAKNQQERFHLKTKTDVSNKLEFPAKTERIKCSFDLNSFQISRNNAAESDRGNLSCQNFQGKNKGFDVWTAFPCKSAKEYNPKDCSCSLNGIKKFHIDLNQHHRDSLIGGAGFLKDITLNCHQLNFSCCRRNSMQPLQSCLEDQTSCCENLSRNPSQNMLPPRNGASFGGNSHFLNNSSASVLESNLEIFAYSGDSEKPRNIIEKHHHWGFSPAAQNAISFMDLENGRHSNFCPSDLYRNEPISALNLLRLMDQAAWSCDSQPHFESYSGSIKETDACVNSQYSHSQFEYVNGEKGTCICPLEVVNPTTGQQPRHSCLLFRPLPRIGSLKPSLQKEIFNYSKYSSLPTSNSHGFLKTDWKEKIKPSHFEADTFECNLHNSPPRCKCSEKIFPDRDPDRCSTSNMRCSVANVDAARVELNNKVDALIPLGSFCKKEICVVNRNPAEFTVIDEHNEYMIAIKELKCKSHPPRSHGALHGQKKQKIMKLNDLKAFAM